MYLADPHDDDISFGARRHRVDSEMDMTPMVDVTFLLLIFFMVTAAFAMQKSFQVPTPKFDRPSSNPMTVEDFEQDPTYVIVRVDEFNTYHISAASWAEEVEAPSLQDLYVQLRRAQSSVVTRGGATRMLLICDGDAHHEKVVQAIDAGNEVGLEDVKIVSADESVM
jgi:biopolymer transport protein ExbD